MDKHIHLNYYNYMLQKGYNFPLENEFELNFQKVIEGKAIPIHFCKYYFDPLVVITQTFSMTNRTNCDFSCKHFRKQIKDHIQLHSKQLPHHSNIAEIRNCQVEMNDKDNICSLNLFYYGSMVPLHNFAFQKPFQNNYQFNSFILKLAIMFDEFQIMNMSPISILNLWVTSDSSPILLIPPFPFFESIDNNLDREGINLLSIVIINLKKHRKENPEKYFSYILGLCLLFFVDNTLVKSLFELLKVANETQINFSVLKSILDSQQTIISKGIQEVICFCLEPDEAKRMNIHLIYKIVLHMHNLDNQSSENPLNIKILPPMKEKSLNEMIIPYPFSSATKTKRKIYQINNYISILNTSEKGSLNLKVEGPQKKDYQQNINFPFKNEESIFRTLKIEYLNSEEINLEFTKKKPLIPPLPKEISSNMSQKLIENDNIIEDQIKASKRIIDKLCEYLTNLTKPLFPDDKLVETIDYKEIILKNLVSNNQISFFNTLLFIQKISDEKINKTFIHLKEVYQGIQNELEALKENISENKKDLIKEISLKMDLLFSEKFYQCSDSTIHYLDLYRQISTYLFESRIPSSYIKAFTNLFYLDLREIDLADMKGKENPFLKILEMNNVFTTIIINQFDFVKVLYEGRSKSMEKNTLSVMLKKIRKLNDFERIIFDHIPFTEAIDELIDALNDKKKLETLSLMKCSLNGEDIAKLSIPIKNCTNLKILNLSENQFNRNDLNIFVESISDLHHLEIFAVQNSKIGGEGIIKLLEKLKEIKTIKELYIGGNDIGDKYALYFDLKLVNHFMNIQALNLSKNSFSEKSAKPICAFLANKVHLSYFRIGENDLKNEGVQIILATFSNSYTNLKLKEQKTFEKIKDLDFGCNNLKDEGAKSIALYLEYNRKIEFLNIMKNDISEEQIISILTILKKQLIPCKINVYGNKAKDEAIQKFFSQNHIKSFLAKGKS